MYQHLFRGWQCEQRGALILRPRSVAAPRKGLGACRLCFRAPLFRCSARGLRRGRFLADGIKRTCRHARVFAQSLNDHGFEISKNLVLNQVLVSLRSPGATRAVIIHLQAGGVCWWWDCVHGRTAMRISVRNWATTETDMQLSIEPMVQVPNIRGRSISLECQRYTWRPQGSGGRR